ncbi:fungal-specific transcription factor [Phycomyces blakesleeanus]
MGVDSAVTAHNRPIKRRARLALSCQRCRKQRSKCSRTRPSCDECLAADLECDYLDTPGDLESTALRNRFSGLEDQIHSLMAEFGVIEMLVKHPPATPVIQNASLQSWSIQCNPQGLSIETHMIAVESIYSALIRFALDNAIPSIPPSIRTHGQQPRWLVRNKTIFPTVKLGHFTSLLPSPQSTENVELDGLLPPLLPLSIVKSLLELYSTCLLHGGLQPFQKLYMNRLMEFNPETMPAADQFLYASIICQMVTHAYTWHPKVFTSMPMTKAGSRRLASQYYAYAKHLLSTLYFEPPTLVACHAACNLVLYHLESGQTAVLYIYSGIAVRMAAALQLYSPKGIERAAKAEAGNLPVVEVEEYGRSVLWLLYFLDTAASHLHSRPYEVRPDEPEISSILSQGPFPFNGDAHQHLFQWLEYQACAITRTIRKTCFDSSVEQIPYDAIADIEHRLTAFGVSLPPLEATDSVWNLRCQYVHRIKYQGLWILLHQTYLPAPISDKRCTDAALAIVDLFEAWLPHIDCYFRPCVHELRQASDILLYHVEGPLKTIALDGLEKLVKVVLQTPVHAIARTRPFVQRLQQVLALHGRTTD